VLCVYGSGFGTKPEDGYFRRGVPGIARRAQRHLRDIAGFTRQFLGA
jgi:hypothetical protein